MVPTQVIGFDGLKERIKQQDKATDEQLEALKDIENSFIEMFMEKRALEFLVKLDECKRKAKSFAHRILVLASNIEIIRAHGYSIQPEEDEWKQRLFQIYSELQNPTEFKGQLNEISSRVKLHKFQNRPSLKNVKMEQDEVNDISKFLETQYQGIEKLTKILRQDLQTLQEIENEYNNRRKK